MIEIFIADDRRLMLEGIQAILKHESDLKVVGTARDGQSAISQVKQLQPDIALIDIEMPKMNGILATKYICQNIPKTKVIVLTSHDNREYVIQALQAGASSYLLKDSLTEDLRQAIYSLHRGYSYVEAKLLSKAVTTIQTANITKYQNKITYLKKHRKSIYKPQYVREERRFLKKHSRLAHQGLTKASLSPIFESPSVREMLANEKPSELGVDVLPRFNRQKYIWRIVWLLLVIVSFVLSVIIF